MNTTISNDIFYRLQLDLLESLFDPAFLSQLPPKHPAQYRWSICKSLMANGCLINWNETDKYFRALSQMVLESDTFVTIGQGSIGKLRIGDISSYGDQAVQTKIKSRLKDPTHFYPLMLELTIAASHMNKRHNVKPMEEDHKPDIRVTMRELDLPVYIECKCVTSTSQNAIIKHIRKANNQIKSVVEACYGLVILDVSNAISEQINDTITDEMPEEVKNVTCYVERTLSGEKNRCIGRVIVTWLKTVKFKSSSHIGLFLIRSIKVVNHQPVPGVILFPDHVQLYEGETIMYRETLNNRGVSDK